MPPLALPSIEPTDEAARAAASQRLDRLTKPPSSLGRLEELAVWLAGVQARALPSAEKRTIFVVAADHGIAARGVSAYPSDVTAQMVENFLSSGAAINVLARAAGAEVVVVDAGVRSDPGPRVGLVSRRIGPGTADFSRGPAMTLDQARACIEAGIALASESDAEIIGCGEMGIGNTTAASAITAVLTAGEPREVTGRGTGLDEFAYLHKVAVIEGALARNAPDADDALDVLAKVGGFEIGVLSGIMLGAAARRKAVLLDGFISTSAALIATGLAPESRAYMLASHLSSEPGHAVALRKLALQPLLDLNLRLGEGTGAALAMPVLDAACRVLGEMATFEEAGVSGKTENEGAR
jgi:nicotinate-nucleotide--dimethylbenzimidazole phosphoribosyltransferase